jgi:hypothetical protein
MRSSRLPPPRLGRTGAAVSQSLRRLDDAGVSIGSVGCPRSRARLLTVVPEAGRIPDQRPESAAEEDAHTDDHDVAETWRERTGKQEQS